MLGAITGDIIGSVYEARKKWQLERNPYFEPLFARKAQFTDDTVLSVATADILLNNLDFAETYQNYYLQYPGAGFGGGFKDWANSDYLEPYGSWGNGSAMRVSPIAWAYDTLDEVLYWAKQSAEVTHNHPEGIKGAQAIATAVFLARTGCDKNEIQYEIERLFNYDLSFYIDDIRPTYTFDSSCQGTVPEAIVSFLESEDFESSVRIAVSLGGDADTLASMSGAIAAAYYGGIPESIRKKTLEILNESLLKVVLKFEERFPNSKTNR